MSVEIVTKDDLEVFRSRLIVDIKQLLNGKKQDSKEWLKSLEVRTMLKVSHGTLQSLRISGKLKYSKIGGTYYYWYEDIIDLLENGRMRK